MYDRTEHGLRHGVVPNFGGLRAAKGFKERWKIVRPFVGGCVEVWKGNTVGGLLFDSKMRKAVRYALEDLLQKRETGGVEKVSFPEMRVGDLTEGMTKERLLRRLEERYGPNRIRNNGRELWEKGIGLGGRGLLGGEMGRKLAQDRGGGRGGGGGGGVNEGVRR